MFKIIVAAIVICAWAAVLEYAVGPGAAMMFRTVALMAVIVAFNM